MPPAVVESPAITCTTGEARPLRLEHDGSRYVIHFDSAELGTDGKERLIPMFHTNAESTPLGRAIIRHLRSHGDAVAVAEVLPVEVLAKRLAAVTTALDKALAQIQALSEDLQATQAQLTANSQSVLIGERNDLKEQLRKAQNALSEQRVLMLAEADQHKGAFAPVRAELEQKTQEITALRARLQEFENPGRRGKKEGKGQQ